MGYTVFLSAGHGGNDSGAVGNGLVEKTVNLNMMLACRTVLEMHGVTVICSRTKDENDPVAEEVNEANKSNAKIAVSFHNNAGGGDGFECFHFSTSKEGKKLCVLLEKYVKQLGQNSRGAKAGDKYYFIRKTKMPAVIVETFFLDNVTDKLIADTVEEQKAFGEAYALAILEYFGIDTEGCETPANDSERYEAIGRAFEKCFKDMDALGSWNELMSLMD